MPSSTSVRPGRGPTLVESSGSAIHTEHGGATAAVTDHGSKSLALVAVIFSSAALGACLILAVLLYGLWARHDLLRIYYNDIRTELIRQGGNPHPHMPSESP